MHVDHHALEFGPGASPVIYEGNDGGVYRSTNGGTIWTLLPDQPITQFYRVALDLQNPERLYGGAQDNGTVRTLTGALDDWANIFGGDGIPPLVHPANSNRIWAQYQYGSARLLAATAAPPGSPPPAGISGSDRTNWNSPVCIDPTNPTRCTSARSGSTAARTARAGPRSAPTSPAARRRKPGARSTARSPPSPSRRSTRR